MRENKTLAAIIGVMVVGGLGLTAVLVMAYSGYSASLEEYGTASSKVAALKGAKLFPSEEHVRAKEDAVTEYEEAVGRLGTVLLALQQPVLPLSDTEFQAKLKSRIAETRQAAAGKTVLPKDFAFGFETYNSSLPKSAEAAIQLGDYLGAIDSIVNMFITCGVKSIDSLERTELAVEKGLPPPPPPEPPKATKKSASSKKTKGKPTEKKAAPPKEIAQVVERRTVTITFTAEQGALQLVMNKLASPSEMVHFTVVRQLRVENEKQEGPLRGSLPRLTGKSAPQSPVPGTDGGAGPPAGTVPVPGKTQVIEPAKPSEPDAQAVFGMELLKVYMEIDLVRFIEPKSTEAGATK